MEDKNITVISDKPNEANTSLSGSSMTKAGRLAMELSQETVSYTHLRAHET